MSAPIQLTGFFTPNDYVDRAMEHLLPQEYVVLSFAARHILGWRDKINERAAPISLEMFEHGFAYTDKETGQPRRFGGCGLARPTISKCLQALETFGFLERAGYLQDKGQMWRLGQWPKWDLLQKRTAERDEANRKRTTKARSKRGRNVALSIEGENTDRVGGRNVTHDDGSNVAHYDGRIVALTESNTSTNPSTSTTFSDTEQTPSADTPITSQLISDGKNTVAAQDTSHEEVIALADSTDTTPVKEAVAPKGSARSSKRKEKAIVHREAAAEPSPYYKPTQDERHAMFEAVCAHVFGVTDKDSIREMARGDHSRAGKIVSWLLRQNDAFAPNGSGKKVVVGLISAPANPQHVAQFAAGYKLKHRDASLPIDIVKFTDAWRAWASEKQREAQRQQRQAQQAAARAADKTTSRATPEELAAIKAEMEQARRQLKEGSAT
jgi:hypothetical protein